MHVPQFHKGGASKWKIATKTKIKTKTGNIKTNKISKTGRGRTKAKIRVSSLKAKIVARTSAEPFPKGVGKIPTPFSRLFLAFPEKI